MKDKLCIVGAGGFAREVLCLALDIYNLTPEQAQGKIVFAVSDAYHHRDALLGFPVLSLSDFKAEEYNCCCHCRPYCKSQNSK
ncbi:hypothetical protein [Cesiribacter sp. SM1]|uniref:hypothetical protein n=1 Tax=Cesiribacter sp. SM1 TaxID=2861196 RepID=UPI001CD5525E|nr:hypothetical protein [Cesiribacter sp. SM1]